MAVVVVWIAEGTWQACVDAARTHVPRDADVVLLHVRSPDVAGAAHGAYAGLLGRGHHPARDPGTRLEHLAAEAADALLAAAAERLGRPCSRVERVGRAEREVVDAVDGADLLVLARDGDLTHRGPRSLGPAGRFVVDHAACPVLLVWPGTAPRPPAPPPPPGPPPPPAG